MEDSEEARQVEEHSCFVKALLGRTELRASSSWQTRLGSSELAPGVHAGAALEKRHMARITHA